MFRCFFIGFLLLLGTVTAFAQPSRETLEAERKKSLEKIEETSKILEETGANRVGSLSKLRAINRQIFERNRVVQSIRDELKILEAEIYLNDDIIAALERDLEQMKKEYAAMLYAISKTKTNQEFRQLSYLLASESLNQLVTRLQYLNQYKETRLQQMLQIDQTRQALEEKRYDLEAKKEERAQLLYSERKQAESLLSLRRQQNLLVLELGKKESSLRVALNQEKKNLLDLNTVISKMVMADMEGVTTGSSEAGSLKLTTEASNMSKIFGNNQTKLIWPVSEGFVSRRFGRQPHPVFDDVMTDNLGIDITTKENALVKAVFEGKVTAVTRVPGMQMMVMVQHGEYFTVYARMKDITVKPGDEITANTPLGRVAANGEGVSELQFQIWKQQHKLDPEQWLAR
jgi:septal ring factor EnvC (AmiA/AmiB activator)